MPSIKTHCAMSKRRTNRDFHELHKWIDADSNRLGVDHRIKRHAFNKKDEKTIWEFWEAKERRLGDKAVVEWLFHIALDNLHTAYKKAKLTYGERAHNFFKFGLPPGTNYILLDFDKLEIDELEEEFENYSHELVPIQSPDSVKPVPDKI